MVSDPVSFSRYGTPLVEVETEAIGAMI